jgi:hypothetical protein
MIDLEEHRSKIRNYLIGIGAAIILSKKKREYKKPLWF